ncbi:HD family phosphohydrolase [Pelosinus fermentans]|uniref:7TM receptor with intracellular metal dependent phosphohydrolase n=1 Tax=Pelosinus fermentans JBW45 TaxID=1192197 RepID=I9NVK5_9FIRM|nr:HDIG domain-containing metalloprotein [Pelosinus fermentans]AJQ27236.1 7TM receptor with intracellular metal dependent phosphohydrolase [Pelosinus fermentans JBW45]
MISLNNKLREFFTQPTSIYGKPIARRLVLGVAFFLLFMIILSSDFVSDKVSLEVGQVSDRDVIAPRTVAYVDVIKTKKFEDEVLASVANVYDLDVTAIAKAEENIGAIFSEAKQVVGNKELVSAEQKKEKLQQGLQLPLPNNVLDGLVHLDAASMINAEEQSKSILRKFFQRGIRDDDLDIARKHIVIETEEMGLDKRVESVIAGIGQALLKPNFILNVRETDKRKQSAINSMEPVRETVKKGQIMVRRGDIVTPEQIHAVEELGLSKGHVNEMRIFGLAIFVIAVMIIILGYMYRFAYPIYTNDLYLVLLGLITLVTLLLGKAAHYYSDFSAPIAAGALLVAILIDARLGVVISIALALLFGIIVEHDLRAVSTVLIASLIGVYSVSKMAHGYSLTKTGIIIAGVNFVVIGATGFIEQLNSAQILMQGVQGIVSGIAASVITTGLLPYLENAFNITTPLKLLDLAQPNHPLLQRLLLDAPGSYHHSVLVGNLAETAAGYIHADPVTVRVGAYYHDIGKIKRPYFFVENQAGNENPHDKIAPSLSTLIVTSHIKDGVDLCREYKLPQIIIDIVQQHHGTMLVSYFYKRATENEHSECIIEADFRYEGPRPQSKEAALIMLADACEAAVRSIGKPNKNRIEATVRKIIRERLHDGQLDECNVTLKDLNVIGDVFIRVLSSMFHTRIEYPDTLKELERRKAKNGNSNKQSSAKDDSNAGNGTDSEIGVK